MSFTEAMRPHVARELELSADADRRGTPEIAFAHLESAHVLGQPSTRLHVHVHLRMLAWAVRHGDLREAVGQVLRVVGAASKTWVGWVPTGNTGGANVSPFRPMAVRPEHARLLAAARGEGRGGS